MTFQLRGRVILQMDVHVVTGLHVGGAGGKVAIGGVDSPVIRDPITDEPYLPGSSVRGKMRSLVERIYGKEQNFTINPARGKEVKIHTCQKKGDPPATDEQFALWLTQYRDRFHDCEVCSVFGVTGDEPVPHPTALIVRDSRLGAGSVERLKKASTDLPFTEVKWEATIDRVTSAATPRQIERVPAGAIFEGLEMVYNIYEASNLEHFPVIFKALSLVEEDYLGGLGARGSGKVRFEFKKILARTGSNYAATPYPLSDDRSVDANATNIVEWVRGLNMLPTTDNGG